MSVINPNQSLQKNTATDTTKQKHKGASEATPSFIVELPLVCDSR